MSQTPRHIKTDRSLNRPTERRAEKAPASRPVQPAQPDFFAEEKPAPAEPPRRAGGSGGAKPPCRSAPAGGHEPPRRRKKKKKTPLWLPLAVTLAVLAVISGVVVYAVGMVGRVEERRSQVDETTVVFKRAFDDCKIVALVIAADVRKVSVQKLHHLGAVGDRANDV